jgi:DNA-binding response OmpR family regulator
MERRIADVKHRYRLLLRAEVSDGTTTAVSHTTELSTRSVRVQLERPPPIGARVAIVLSLPQLLRRVRAAAVVTEHVAATAPGGFSGFCADLSFADADDRRAVEALFERSDAAALARGMSLRGLVVDDSLIVREIFSYTFRRRTRVGPGSTIDLVADAAAASELLAHAQYDFAVVDYLLPSTSGAELVAAIRADERHAGMAIVGISVGGAEARSALLAAGADLYLNKPMEVVDLCTTLQVLAAKPVAAVSPPGPARRKILIVDDSPMMLELARDALEAAGYQPFATSDLAEMGRLLEREQPDLILLDVQMPEAYGDDVANVLRGLRNVSVPVLLFSILDEKELADRAKAAAVDGYIYKGAGLNEMVRRVRALLGADAA